jgi:hypothetical protein
MFLYTRRLVVQQGVEPVRDTGSSFLMAKTRYSLSPLARNSFSKLYSFPK